MNFYLLDENKQPYEVSLEESYKLYSDINMKVVQQDKLDNGMFVSTVFLGMDHGWGDKTDPEYKPVLFETMIFDDSRDSDTDDYQERYTSYEDALEGHNKALEIAKNYRNGNSSLQH